MTLVRNRTALRTLTGSPNLEVESTAQGHLEGRQRPVDRSPCYRSGHPAQSRASSRPRFRLAESPRATAPQRGRLGHTDIRGHHRPMSAATRVQRRYDHRLRELVRSTGDIGHAIRRGVPRSTARAMGPRNVDRRAARIRCQPTRRVRRCPVRLVHEVTRGRLVFEPECASADLRKSRGRQSGHGVVRDGREGERHRLQVGALQLCVGRELDRRRAEQLRHRRDAVADSYCPAVAKRLRQRIEREDSRAR